ncbi:MAG: hypothetical protein ACOC44_11740 [Promethearchaeia archaeon]
MNLKETALKIFEAMFNEKDDVPIDNRAYKIQVYHASGVKHVDIGDYRFIEQNPNKDSHWANKAQHGHEIMRILKDWDYIGQVHNGKYKNFRDK